DEGEEEEQGHLVAVVDRLLLAVDMPHNFRPKRRLGEEVQHVWELTSVQEEVAIDALLGLCRVCNADDITSGIATADDEAPT
ncbi:unnamed protein product, partial [Laminaria digitata]